MILLTPNLCELIGSIIGDGNIYDKIPSYVEITGHPKNDLQYFESFLLPTIKNELNYDAKIKIRYGAIRIRINNKNFVKFLKYIGIPSGKGKFEKVRVPQPIIGKSVEHTKACIRGIFDTDGSVYFDKRKIYRKPYIRIELHMSNKELLTQISGLLTKMNIESKLPENKTTLYINGKDNVNNYLKRIGFRNSRHSERIKSLYPELISSNICLRSSAGRAIAPD